MAHTSDINYILDRITQEDIRNYSILDGDKKTVIEESQDNSLTSDMVRSRVERTLRALSGGGIVWISLSSKSKLEKAAGGNVGTNKMIAFNTGGQMPGIGSTGGDTASSIGAISAALEEKFNAKLEAMQLQNKHDAEIRDLQNKLEEAQNSSPIVKMIEPILPQIITGLFGQMPRPIAGPPKEETTAVQVEEISNEEQEAIENALTRLISVDPDFPIVLQKLAHLAENNLQMYNQAKTLLNTLS
jgi:hypothetical protein